MTGLLAVGSVALCRGELGDAYGALTEAKALAELLPEHTLADVTHATSGSRSTAGWRRLCNCRVIPWRLVA